MSAGRDITSPAELPARMRAKITEELCPVAGLDGFCWTWTGCVQSKGAHDPQLPDLPARCTAPRLSALCGPGGVRMSADLIPFAYHATPVRVVTIDGEPWFVLADLCRVLTLSSPHKVYDRIADDAKGRTSIPTPGGDQQMAVVSEAGMYEVVIRSDKAEAVEFRRWITGTVLPEIRKTGSYGAPKLAELSRRDILTMALEAEDRADREAAARLEAESQVRELIPPASAWNALADTNGDYAVGDAAKILSRDPE